MVSTEVDRYDGVDEAEVPSAKWGWSKINHRTWHFVGLFIIGFLLLMLHGNHVGKVEDIFLIDPPLAPGERQGPSRCWPPQSWSATGGAVAAAGCASPFQICSAIPATKVE